MGTNGTEASTVDTGRRPDDRGGWGGPVVVAFFFAALGLLYGVGEAIAVLWGDEVTTTLSSVAAPSVAGLPAGAHLVEPMKVAVATSAAPTGAVVMLKMGAALVAVLWGVAVLCIALLMRASIREQGLYGASVLRQVAALRWTLVALVLAYGLRVFGANWLVGFLGDGFSTWSSFPEFFLPVFAGYLVFAFETVLRRGARLQGELDEVI